MQIRNVFSQAELEGILEEEQRRQRKMSDEADALLIPEERQGSDRRRKEVQREVEVVKGWGQATIYVIYNEDNMLQKARRFFLSP